MKLKSLSTKPGRVVDLDVDRRRAVKRVPAGALRAIALAATGVTTVAENFRSARRNGDAIAARQSEPHD
jgi:hypothetical protein